MKVLEKLSELAKSFEKNCESVAELVKKWRNSLKFGKTSKSLGEFWKTYESLGKVGKCFGKVLEEF